MGRGGTIVFLQIRAIMSSGAKPAARGRKAGAARTMLSPRSSVCPSFPLSMTKAPVPASLSTVARPPSPTSITGWAGISIGWCALNVSGASEMIE